MVTTSYLPADRVIVFPDESPDPSEAGGQREQRG